MDTNQFTHNQFEEQEEWRPVVGYEGYYSVSSLGRVRRDRSGKGVMLAGRIMQIHLNHHGYPRVRLSRGNKGSNPLVHRLVAIAFLGPVPDGFEVNHKDGNKLKCHLSNIEYVTHQENVRHANEVLNVIKGTRARGLRAGVYTCPERRPRGLRNGKYTKPEATPRGEAHGGSKLTTENVIEMRRLYSTGNYRYKDLSNKFGVSIPTVGNIINRVIWAHVV